MLEMFLKMQNKRRAKGGFTLVELIVVLVILAILAALLIPALTGYIDRAKEKSIIAETRQAVMAAQTLVDEAYASLPVGSTTAISVGDAATNKVKIEDIAKLAELDKKNITSVTVYAAKEGTTGKESETDKGGKIKQLVYTNKGKTCTYTESPATGHDKYEVSAAK